MFRYANLLSEISGATSYEQLAADISSVMERDEVEHVILDINSPGGEVDGMSETAALIASYRGTKPITAFISHLGASGGYGLASGADRIIAADMAIVGSIGVVAGVSDYRKADEKRGVQRLEFVSSQTPLKRVDVFADDSDERAKARAVVQKRVDSLAQVFIDNTARYRGVKSEMIAATSGALFVGREAVEVRLVDSLGTLESLVSSINAGDKAGRSTLVALGGITSQEDRMIEKGEKDKETPAAPAITRAYLDAHHPELVAAIRDEGHKAGLTEGTEKGRIEGATSERERVLGIQAIEAKGHDELKLKLMNDPKVTRGDAALQILQAKGQAESKQREAVKDGLTDDEKVVAGVKSDLAKDGAEGEEEAVAQAVLKHATAWQKSGLAE
jgi:signal peptide peptidase SppA